MTAIYEYHHQVTDDEIDGLGHASNLAFVRWMQDAALAHSAYQGWDTERYYKLGAVWVVRSHHIEYLRPAFAGDPLVVQTWVSSFKRISSVRKYKMKRLTDGQPLAIAETNWVFVSQQQLAPRRIPPELSDAFELVPENQEP